MTQDPVEGWVELAERFGPTVAVLLAVLFVGGLVLWRIARWFKPWVERLMKAHLQFLERTGETVEEMRVALPRIEGAQVRAQDKLETLCQENRKTCASVTDLATEMRLARELGRAAGG